MTVIHSLTLVFLTLMIVIANATVVVIVMVDVMVIKYNNKKWQAALATKTFLYL